MSPQSKNTCKTPVRKLWSIFCILLYGACALAGETLWNWTYDGSFEDGRALRMTLAAEYPNVSGRYFVSADPQNSKFFWVEHDIRACLNAPGGPVPPLSQLTAVDDRGNPSATFTGDFIAPQSGGNCSFNEEIGGTFQSLDGGFSRRFSLSLSHGVAQAKGAGRYSENPADDATVEQNVRLLLAAIQTGDQAAVAARTDFPLTVNGLSKKPKEIRNTAEFLKLYDLIFTAKFKTAVLATIPHDLFVNYHGIMLGDGEIWLTHQGRIAGLNAE